MTVTLGTYPSTENTAINFRSNQTNKYDVVDMISKNTLA
jgi:hypothetical protein